MEVLFPGKEWKCGVGNSLKTWYIQLDLGENTCIHGYIYIYNVHTHTLYNRKPLLEVNHHFKNCCSFWMMIIPLRKKNWWNSLPPTGLKEGGYLVGLPGVKTPYVPGSFSTLYIGDGRAPPKTGNPYVGYINPYYGYINPYQYGYV